MRKPFMILFGVVIFISACVNQGKHTPTIPSGTSKPSAVAINTQMPIQSTWTPRVVKPTITPTPKLTHIDIPEWVSDPNVSVLLLPMGESLQFKNFALVNADSGEIYNLSGISSGDYFWMNDGKHFGIFTKGESEILLVDTVSGEIAYHHPSERAVQYVHANTETTYSFKTIGEKVEDPKFMLVYPWWNVSADNHYLVLENPYYDPGFTRVLDLRTDEIITLTDADDSIFDIAREWSPTGSYLGIVHSDEEPGIGFSFEKDPNFRLKIYDIEHGDLIGSYKNIPDVNWSPDGTKLLYQPWTISPESHEFSHARNPPCVFDPLTGKTKCYNEAVVHHTIITPNSLTFHSIQWSPDGKMIGYIYSRIDYKLQEPFYEEHGGICLITIEDNSTKCMLEKTEGDKQNKKPVDYWWSPNEDYLVFIIRTFEPLREVGDPELGILNIASGEYFIIKKHDLFRFDASSWRPKINP